MNWIPLISALIMLVLLCNLVGRWAGTLKVILAIGIILNGALWLDLNGYIIQTPKKDDLQIPRQMQPVQ